MKTIKELLTNKQEVNLVCGAANALIAKLAENAGFDGVWLSSFEMHAWNRFPDASILNVADYADAINKISDRINIPILVDSDEGGPSAINTIRMAREYSKAGAWGMCIEDNPSPKRCSFYGMKSELEKTHIMIGKIKAALQKSNKENFAVIARTEALIQNRGIPVALERAKAYTDAGCDGFLIHNKNKNPDEVMRFCDLYHKEGLKTPLVIVPTTYNQMTVKQMQDCGVSLAIYANYSVRAAVKTIESMFKKVIENGTLSAGNDYAVPMTKIFDIIGVEEMKENQEKYGS
jgi:phosphoenolpyruvate phosphomutase|tara:strand:+ start:340 stop:1209 length:870 start_codon:yes stop_codon:yes gene_type:complete